MRAWRRALRGAWPRRAWRGASCGRLVWRLRKVGAIEAFARAERAPRLREWRIADALEQSPTELAAVRWTVTGCRSRHAPRGGW
ncbi:hypothetical protein FHS42_005067 [Streptomyces zagrosensis]|uniref:Uncharacterized protein n=1 Tax=Streptomyces zagrosensis TaxID=1042984 RepID=A0A7W9V0B8_9ACTN|nr:hypothetical protein [Streptomyces zagrosensis]